MCLRWGHLCEVYVSVLFRVYASPLDGLEEWRWSNPSPRDVLVTWILVTSFITRDRSIPKRLYQLRRLMGLFPNERSCVFP